MMVDILTGSIEDPFGGLEDLQKGILHHTSEQFSEDPLRVLRGMQFLSRMGFRASQELEETCSKLVSSFSELPKERVWEEWKKWAAKAQSPSKGLEFLRNSGWVSNFPELEALIDLKQEPSHHPEGDVWEHTLHTVDAACKIAGRENLPSDRKVALMLGALCHDFGKVTTTEVIDGVITSRKHNVAGEEPTRSFMARIGAPKDLTEEVVHLVREHMIHVFGELTDSVVKKLSSRINGKTTVIMVSHVIEADHGGRPPFAAVHPCPQILEMAARLNVLAAQPKPFLTGRHLISLGFKPGQEMGKVLKELFDLQLEGKIASEEEAITFAKTTRD